ncbi:MOSC domain-containing protein [Paenibacillus sp. YYML68]|uniref:MOSC domain-containing protein n=1 Tax=Paenibacillus sp. YYML68 TaxID=2909250 RepID=UPI0024925408|nr:MOSC domain-containing protein [Paenibacillus sp. YYML68]
MTAYVKSLNVAQPVHVQYGKQEVLTGIYKQPSEKPLKLGKLHFEGDGQGDLVHHGGADKAVCVYPYEHYDFWEKGLQLKLEPGAFGENVTVVGWVETEVHVGDTFRLGEAIVQVSQPRQPCYKLSMRHGWKELPVRVQETGYTGYYFRVLEEGVVAQGDMLERTAIHAARITVEEVNRVMHRDKQDVEAIRRLLAIDELSASWRATLEKRLAGHVESTAARLDGQQDANQKMG